MEKRDLEMIESLMKTNVELKALYDQHIEFEKELEKLNNKSYLTPIEDIERRTIQKKKLLGRDRIEIILRQHRAAS